MIIAKSSNRHALRILYIITFILFVCGIAILASSINSSFAYAKQINKVESITLSAAGDCTLGVDSRYTNTFNSYFKKYGSPYFLKNVKKVFDKDDVTLVNFEGTLTKAKRRATKTFTFKGPSKYARILKKGSVEVVNLANNHSKDYLNKGFIDTTATLDRYKIPYCYKTKIAYKNVKGAKMAFLGFNELDGVTKKQIQSGINNAKKNDAEIIVVSFHWGIEKQYSPTQNQKSLGRYAIDCGASLVIGHHPHVLQGVEKYKGRRIVYSLGNFCFGGNTNPKDKDTMIFQQTFTVKNGKLISMRSAKVIPCSLSGKSSTNTYQPRVLKGKSRNRVMGKIRNMSSKLHTTIGTNGNLY